MKRVIIFSYDFPPNNGGVSRLTSNIAKHLNLQKRENYTIEVLTIRNERRINKQYDYPIHTVVSTLKGRTFDAYRFLTNIKDKKNVIVICGLWWPEGLVAEIAGIKNIFILTHAAEIRPDNTWFRKKIWIPVIASTVLTKAKGVLANSKFTSDLSKSLSKNSNVHCLPLAVDEFFFHPTKAKKNDDGLIHLLTVSRIHLWKGLDTILHAICKLPKSARDRIRWDICGKGPDLETFKKMVKSSKVSSQVNFLGFVEDEELPYIYAVADLFVLCTRADINSSNIEGFGLVFLESQASGTPVIGTPFGGIPSAIEDGNGGWLVSSEEELMQVLLRLVQDPKIIQNQGLAARQRVELKCTWRDYIEKLLKIIER